MLCPAISEDQYVFRNYFELVSGVDLQHCASCNPECRLGPAQGKPMPLLFLKGTLCHLELITVADA
jgi:hypothetical protein